MSIVVIVVSRNYACVLVPLIFYILNLIGFFVFSNEVKMRTSRTTKTICMDK